MSDKPPRCLATVLEAMLRECPAEHPLHAILTKTADDSCFAPPEDQYRFWVRAQLELEQNANGIPASILERMGSIWENRAPATAGSAPIRSEGG